MKRKAILNVILSVLLTFSVLGMAGSLIVRKVICNYDFIFAQIEKSNTYEITYDSLMARFSEISSANSIPVEVYEEAFTLDWTKQAVNAQIMITFGDVFDEAALNYSPIENSLTAYFEHYANENHVIRDESYAQQLKDTIHEAVSTAESVTDVCSLRTMQNAGIWNRVEALQKQIDKIVTGCMAATIICLIVLIILRDFVYWTGTSAFAGGLIFTAFALYIRLSGSIARFPADADATYTLVTGMMNTVVDSILRTGLILVTIGLVMVACKVFVLDRKTK